MLVEYLKPPKKAWNFLRKIKQAVTSTKRYNDIVHFFYHEQKILV